MTHLKLCLAAAGKRRAFAVFLALCLLFSGCGSSQAEDEEPDDSYSGISGKVLETTAAADHVFSVNYDPEGGLNPIRAGSGVNMMFSSLMYDTLFVVDTDYSFSSEIVKEYTTDDYIWWIFTIDTSIQFTDGSYLTPQDVAYSLQRAQQSSFYSGRMSSVYGISTLDETRIAMSAATANSQLPAMLNIPIVKYGTAGDDVPIGTGPYQLAESGNRLVRFEGNRHANELPVQEIWLKSYIDVAENISAFENSLLDIAVNDPTGVYSVGYGGSNEIRTYDTNNLHFIGFNFNSNVFQNAKARYAMNYIVDRDEVVNQYMSGIGNAVTLPVQPASGLYDEAYAATFRYDLDKCAEYFDAAGITDMDSDGVPEVLVTGIVVEISLDFIVNNDSTVKIQTARRITEHLNAMGIKTTLHELPWEDYTYRLINGKFDLYYGEIRLTADWNLSPLFSTNSAINYARCRDGTFAQRYREYLASNSSGRAAAFSEASHYLAENGGIIPICFEKQQMITHRGVVSGATPTQYDLFHDFYKWTIDLS